ncbi:histidinol-phosphate aminotransferase [Histomonas meleagridis]|uniref:histidinol-phosphate aminotransferase n=1 Tax=Histomonas meleagridis TaxID=135588 RepID=UPI003559894F|nr:histidinol-phosphate aminotransferase [Histomonas meleagridis]KAH0805335.1 histidinol-phosphate aminotransferase [Histomonas meleagridis]
MSADSDPRLHYVKPAVECFHGGQSYYECPNFKYDFSVSTNISGPPKTAVEAAKKAIVDLEHYPDQDAWVPRCHLADFLGIDPMQILMGNGSSELIDVLFRVFPPTTTYKEGPWDCQYHEYARAAESSGLVKVSSFNEPSALTIIINPNTPTGNYLELSELREIISKEPNSTFIIDESFLINKGRDWLQSSAINLVKEFGDRVVVIISWTKPFACPLIRLGSVISSKAMIARIAKLQAPWSVNGFAQNFFVAALHEKDYFEEMWRETPIIKAEMIKILKEMKLEPNEKSPLWVPYVYLKMPSSECAKVAEKVSFDNGMPVRNCESFGKPDHLRISVRRIDAFKELIAAWKADKKLMEMINAGSQ